MEELAVGQELPTRPAIQEGSGRNLANQIGAGIVKVRVAQCNRALAFKEEKEGKKCTRVSSMSGRRRKIFSLVFGLRL